MLMQLALQEGILVYQMDVKTAYLNAPIDCELYMKQPGGYERKGANGEKLVCKLKKSLMVLNRAVVTGITCYTIILHRKALHNL